MQPSAREVRCAGKGEMRVLSTNENSLGVLRGAPEIARAIGTTTRRAYYLLENGVLPGVKEGSIWTCTLDALRRFYEGKNGAAS